MQVQIIFNDDAQKGQVIPITIPSFLIGRGSECNLRSGSSGVCEKHCVITIENEVVSIEDLHTESGTFVNGEKILFPKVLKDGDEIGVGRLVFVMSIRVPDELGSKSKDGAELIFDIRLEGQRLSVTKDRLLGLAKQGLILPDDVVTICGTKVFADTIQGIVFGKEAQKSIPPVVTPIVSPIVSPAYSVQDPIPSLPSVSEPEITDSAIFGFFQNEVAKTSPGTGTPAPSLSETSNNESADDSESDVDPFNVQDEPTAQVIRPAKTEKSVFTEIGEKIAPSIEKVDSSQIKDWAYRNKRYFPFVLGGLCLLGLIGIYLSWGPASPPGIYYVQGTLTLDGESVEGVNVLLLPRGENGEAAGGITDAKGRFTVTTGAAPGGTGAKEGEYDITFSKTESEGDGLSATEYARRFRNRRPEVKYVIPKKYEDPKTSGITPVSIAADGSNKFKFELLTVGTTIIAKKEPEELIKPSLPDPPQKKVSLIPKRQQIEPKPKPVRRDPPAGNIIDAVKRGSAEDVFYFIEIEADVNVKDSVGNTPLHWIHLFKYSSDIDAVKQIVTHGGDVKANNVRGETPLHRLATSPSPVTVEAVRYLVSRGSGINALDRSGRTPLHCIAATTSSSPYTNAALRYFIDCGAEINIQDNEGKTPLDVANTDEKKAILLAAGAVEGTSAKEIPLTESEMKEGPGESTDLPPDMQYRVGMKFYLGTKEIPQSRSIALKWFYAAAQKGYADAQFRVGTYYYFGWEVPKNESESINWLQKAAAQDQREASELLKEIDRQKEIFGN